MLRNIFNLVTALIIALIMLTLSADATVMSLPDEHQSKMRPSACGIAYFRNSHK